MTCYFFFIDCVVSCFVFGFVYICIQIYMYISRVFFCFVCLKGPISYGISYFNRPLNKKKKKTRLYTYRLRSRRCAGCREGFFFQQNLFFKLRDFGTNLIIDMCFYKMQSEIAGVFV